MSHSVMECDKSYFTRLLEAARPLPIRLAQDIVITPVGNQERHAMLARLFLHLTIADQMRCTSEVYECRAAIRGMREAQVTRVRA